MVKYKKFKQDSGAYFRNHPSDDDFLSFQNQSQAFPKSNKKFYDDLRLPKIEENFRSLDIPRGISFQQLINQRT